MWKPCVRWKKPSSPSLVVPWSFPMIVGSWIASQTHILAFEGDSEVVFIEGNFSDYHEDFLRRKGKDAQPHRMKYKRLEK